MEGIITNIEQYMNHVFVILTILFIISEGLAQIPSIKANSVFQALSNIIKNLYGLFGKKQLVVKEKEIKQEGENVTNT